MVIFFSLSLKMISCVKTCRRFTCFASLLIESDKRLVNVRNPFTFFLNCSSQTRLFSIFQIKGFLLPNEKSQLILSRNKSKGRSKKRENYDYEESSDEEEEEEEEDEDEECVVDDNAEVKTLRVNSLRTDLLLKSVFGISRKKIEEHFYKNKIRCNGKILFKKSYIAQEDDEIDLIKEVVNHKMNTLKIARVKILKVKLDEDSNKFILKAGKFSSLIINNYDGINTWKESEELN